MHTTSSGVDVAIIGAGYAGLVCARTLASRSLSVRVFERKHTTGEPLHATEILVKKTAEALDIPHRPKRRIHGVRLHPPSLRCVGLHSSGY